MLRVQVARAKKRLPVSSVLGHTRISSEATYGESMKAPTRSGSSHGMKLPMRIARATGMKNKKAAVRAPRNRPSRKSRLLTGVE